MKPFEGTYKIAGIVAAVHLVGVVLTAWYVSVASQTSGQAVLVWVYWGFIDFPISFLAYSLLNGQFFLAHALIGTLWWFFLVAVIVRIIQALRGRAGVRTSDKA
jgi:hypothetical protein